MAHEVGHWLGLYHTFQGSTCLDDDGIEDTPNTDKHGWGWLPSSDPCNSQDSKTAYVRCGNTVMVKNVMDYNYDQCNQYFSKQQAAVMRGYLASPYSSRSSLGTSPALAPICSNYNCFGKSCGPDGCGGTCGSCSTLNACAGDGTCRSTIPRNIDCKSAEGLTQSTSVYSVTKDNTGVNNNPSSCSKLKMSFLSKKEPNFCVRHDKPEDSWSSLVLFHSKCDWQRYHYDFRKCH